VTAGDGIENLTEPLQRAVAAHRSSVQRPRPAGSEDKGPLPKTCATLAGLSADRWLYGPATPARGWDDGTETATALSLVRLVSDGI
jgi:hypothetical protein